MSKLFYYPRRFKRQCIYLVFKKICTITFTLEFIINSIRMFDTGVRHETIVDLIIIAYYT